MTEALAVVPQAEEQKQLVLEQKVTSVEEIANGLKLLEKVDTLSIKGIDDKAGYKAVDALRKDMKGVAVLVEKKCKEEREEAIKVQKTWIAISEKLSKPFREAEKKLDDQIKAIDAEKARIEEQERIAREQRVNGRVDRLIKCTCEFDGFNYSKGELTISMAMITEMDDSLFDAFMDKVQAVYQQEQEEAAKVALEERTWRRRGSLIDAGMQLDEELNCYTFSNSIDTCSIAVGSIESLDDNGWSGTLLNIRKFISSCQNQEREAQQAKEKQLEDDRKALEKEKMQVRVAGLEAIGMSYDVLTEKYVFKNGFANISTPAVNVPAFTQQEFIGFLDIAKRHISEAREEEAEQKRIIEERDRRISSRGEWLKPIGFVKAHDHYYHSLYNISKVTFEVLDTCSEEEWSALLQECVQAVAKHKADAEAEEKRKADQAEADRLESIRKENERQEALKPDREKLQAFVDLVLTIKPPTCNTAEGAGISYEAAAALEQLANKIRGQIKAM